MASFPRLRRYLLLWRHVLSWPFLEPRLYKLYYALPGLSYHRKRQLILRLHRSLGGLTRRTESYQHYLRRTAEPERAPADLWWRPTYDYQAWRLLYGALDDGERERLRARMAGWKGRPLISVLLPVYDVEEDWLARAVESVRGQLYPHWELCVADDGSTAAHVRPLLERYAGQDPRIRVVFREVNGHIVAASNTALELARGGYVALLDHDDELAETALYWVADALERHPTAGLLYSDEDKLDGAGRRTDPYFKCAWNPDLMLSQNLVSHLGVYRRDLVEAVGGFRPGLEGSQDYDLALRVAERLAPEQIVHIPRVLYHWRAIPGSTARGGAEKPYARAAAERAVNDALARRGVAARAAESALVPGMLRVRYQLPAPAPAVSLIIPTRNGLALLERCLDSVVARTTYPDYEILILDNGSDDPATLGYLKAVAGRALGVPIRVLRDARPFNYSQLNNEGVRAARGTVVGLLNNDLEVIAGDWLEEMVSHACRPEVGAVGARLLYPSGRVQHAGVIVGIKGVAGHFHRHLPGEAYGYFSRAQLIQDFSAVTAACLVLRRAVYWEAGGMDEVDLPVAFNDVDLCLKLGALGYRVVYTPHAELYHHESATRGAEDESPEKAARAAREIAVMKRRWNTEHYRDPAYSPNLTLGHANCDYAFPPHFQWRSR
ncbi:MAG: glycosyltransferase family 2 protein [Candidatus Competibacteraceae bacterium]